MHTRSRIRNSLALLIGLAACFARAASAEDAPADPKVTALEAQKAVIDAQKSLLDSQNQLLTSQKTMLDSLFPLITGGKTGVTTFDATTKIGPYAQPQAVSLNDLLAADICGAIPKDGDHLHGIIVANDSVMQTVAQARLVGMQLDALKAAYIGMYPDKSLTATTGTQALPAVGAAIYGVGAVLKQVASFTQLFRSDTAVYGADVTMDQAMLESAVMRCAIAGGAPVASTTTVLLKALKYPATSTLMGSLQTLARYRAQTEAEVQAAAPAKPKDTAVANDTRVATLKALNAQYDMLLASLIATSEKQPEPTMISALAGDSMLSLLTDEGSPRDVLIVRFVQGAGSAYKKSSLWSSDKLVTRVTATASYRLLGANGDILAAGTVARDTEPTVVTLDATKAKTH